MLLIGRGKLTAACLRSHLDHRGHQQSRHSDTKRHGAGQRQTVVLEPTQQQRGRRPERCTHMVGQPRSNAANGGRKPLGQVRRRRTRSRNPCMLSSRVISRLPFAFPSQEKSRVKDRPVGPRSASGVRQPRLSVPHHDQERRADQLREIDVHGSHSIGWPNGHLHDHPRPDRRARPDRPTARGPVGDALGSAGSDRHLQTSGRRLLRRDRASDHRAAAGRRGRAVSQTDLAPGRRRPTCIRRSPSDARRSSKRSRIEGPARRAVCTTWPSTRPVAYRRSWWHRRSSSAQPNTKPRPWECRTSPRGRSTSRTRFKTPRTMKCARSDRRGRKRDHRHHLTRRVGLCPGPGRTVLPYEGHETASGMALWTSPTA